MMKSKMKWNRKMALMLGSAAVLTTFVLSECSSSSNAEAPAADEGIEQVGIDSGSEESGTELALDATYDQIRNGVRLTMHYDAQSNTFVGTVANTTEDTLQQVRVEVHLSNGSELGPTESIDLVPGEKAAVSLQATSQPFDGWVAHPEVGGGASSGEHGNEAGGENGSEGGGEHGGG